MKSNKFHYGIYVTNTLVPEPTPDLVATVKSLGDAYIIADALNKSVVEAPLSYTVKTI
jgi:hypothetical protein